MTEVSRVSKGTAYARHGFRCMGTEMLVLGPGGSEWSQAFVRAARRVEEVFADANDRFTRFSPDSELSRVNTRAGAWTQVSPEFATLLRVSLQGAAETGGLFDPTVLPALMAAGYDRDFAEARSFSPKAFSGGGRWRDVEVDGDLVRFPSEAALDFGGIGKGWAVDLAESAVADLPWALVSAGGDLRVFGQPPGGIEIAIDDPLAESCEAGHLTLDEGAVASSSVACRAWGPGLHHLIDPRTFRPAVTGVVQTTVWAPTCTEAEVRSKWALLAGAPALEHFPGVLVLEDGRIVTNLLPEGAPEECSEVPA